MTLKSVLLIGLIPELIDFDAIGVSNLNAAKVRALISDEEGTFEKAGYDPHHLLIDLGETAEAVIGEALGKREFACIIVGAGLRLPPPYLKLFEKVINVIHERAPRSKICFNTSPSDSLEAVRRWV